MYSGNKSNLTNVKRQHLIRRILSALTDVPTNDIPTASAAGGSGGGSGGGASDSKFALPSSATASITLPAFSGTESDRAARTALLSTLSSLPLTQQLQTVLFDALSASGTGRRSVSSILEVLEWCHAAMKSEQIRITQAQTEWITSERARKQRESTDPTFLAEQKEKAAKKQTRHDAEMARRAAAEEATRKFEAELAAEAAAEQKVRDERKAARAKREARTYLDGVVSGIKGLNDENPDSRYGVEPGGWFGLNRSVLMCVRSGDGDVMVVM